MRRQSFLSREFFEAEVTAETSAGVAVDPDDLPVEFAFVAPGTPGPEDDDWQDATHLRDNVFGVLVGPDALELPRADYDVWFQATDDPEKPTEPFGKLRIY